MPVGLPLFVCGNLWLKMFAGRPPSCLWELLVAKRTDGGRRFVSLDAVALMVVSCWTIAMLLSG